MSVQRKTKQISRDKWWFRFYCWLWEADPDKAEFCKLFWGLLFSPIGLLMYGVGIVLLFLTKPVRVKHQKRVELRKLAQNQPPLPAEEKKKKRRAERLDTLIRWAGNVRSFLRVLWTPFRAIERFVNRVEDRWPWTELIPHVIFFGFLGSCGVYALYRVALIVPWSEWALYIGIFFGGIIVFGVYLLFFGRKTGDLFLTGVLGASRAAKKGGLGFWQVMGIGYHAVKDRTCPIIEVVD